MNTKRTHAEWLTTETALLRTVYPSQGIAGCRELLKRHTKSAIYRMTLRLELKRTNRWTGAEDQVLLGAYAEQGTRGCVAALETRTKQAIRARAARLPKAESKEQSCTA